jgi:cell division protein ZipA
MRLRNLLETDLDISTFRWILVIAGVLLIVGLYLFGVREKKRKPRASRRQVRAERVRREPALDASHNDEDAEGSEHDARQVELAIGDPGGEDGRIEPQLEAQVDSKPKKPAAPPPDKIVTLFLQARDNQIITGIDLLDSSLKSGLVFGSHDIFHRIHEEDVEPVFSMANLTKPGSFDKSAWNTMEIKGVTMFMTLPGPRNALDAWDSMLATSRRLAELLHADLLDSSQKVFTRERSMHIKEELREYERQKNPES